MTNPAANTLLFGIEHHVAMMDRVLGLLNRTSLILSAWCDVLGLNVHALNHALASACYDLGDSPDRSLVLASDNLLKQGPISSIGPDNVFRMEHTRLNSIPLLDVHWDFNGVAILIHFGVHPALSSADFGGCAI